MHVCVRECMKRERETERNECQEFPFPPSMLRSHRCEIETQVLE